ncbi:MAG: M20/M25/M40 family metallo-hydrolase [Elusimicrobia bacterium]|nr:M20/M25/M40 family metallo-hydrolase [Elusimicrobiota bacterium]
MRIDQAARKKMLNTFIELAKIPSPSKKEGLVAARLEKELRALGCRTVTDGAGKKIGGQTGNLIAYLPGKPGARPFLISAHMDTVTPCEGVKPIVESKRVRSDGTTILGADCKGALSGILQALRIIKENNLPHPPLELALTICEEQGMAGARNMDYSKISARYGLVLDSECADKLTLFAPAADEIQASIHGKASHAGMLPEAGISAIHAAARGLVRMKTGRIDFETTANIGFINGGGATNIVTPLVELKGEARSHTVAKLKKQSEHMKRALEQGAAASSIKYEGKTYRAKADVKIIHKYPNLVVPKDASSAKLAFAAARRLGLPLNAATGGGGSDANFYYTHGIVTPNLGCGMRDPHTTGEYLELKDFFNCAELVLETLVLAAETGN